MKKGTILNSRISAVIAEMGHTDQITIGDAGLPIPPKVDRIDLSLVRGIPKVYSVLEAVLTELEVEKVTLAKEMKHISPNEYNSLVELLRIYNKDILIEDVSHSTFKERMANSKAVIRTGECTPYVNVILHSGVSF